MVGMGAYHELDVLCRGRINSMTGYLINIREIDEAVRLHALPVFQRAHRAPVAQDPPEVLQAALEALRKPLDGLLASLRWRMTPYYCLTMHEESTDRLILRQQFEFAASHRLHCATLSDQENQALFGKCNRGSGHGHNYRLEPAVVVPWKAEVPARAFNVGHLESIVDESIIRRFDHTHLNLDVPEFADLNPSVENIAKVCFELLAPPISAAGALLKSVTVWETDKTSCTYPG